MFVQQLAHFSQLYSANGRWTHVPLSNISFTIPGCIDPVVLEPLIPYLPTTPDVAPLKEAGFSLSIPKDVAAPVLQRLERLGQAAERIYRVNAPVLDGAYSALADRERARMMTLTQIAKTLLAPGDLGWTPSSAALLAVRKALQHNPFRFHSDWRSQRLTNVFTIRPKNGVEMVETVQHWVRQFEQYRASRALGPEDAPPGELSKGAAYVMDFAAKARRLVAISRKHREPLHGHVGPSKIPEERSTPLKTEWNETFSKTDKLIINFLQAWVMTMQFRKMQSLVSSCATILQATGCYETPMAHMEGSRSDGWTEMDEHAGHLFLQEIGVVAPHDNRAIYDENLMLPTVSTSRNLELLKTKAELIRSNPDFRDSMADLRKDWDTLEVYCIDDAGAHEIDDGVSVSKVDGTASEYWVHVHVANPTAFFDKTHVLSGLAAHMTGSVYMPERAFPMLPKWATENYFGLAPDRPVLTFSTRLDVSGAILERKVQPGIVRRITSITPDELAESFGEATKTTATRLVVGGELPSTKDSHLERDRKVLSATQLEDLKNMYDIAGYLWKKREAAGGQRGKYSDRKCRLFEGPAQIGLRLTPPSTDRARFIHGDPIVELTCHKATDGGAESNNITSYNIVEEMMLLACETAASWCAERHIPLLYRGTVETVSSGFTIEQLKEKVQGYREKHGNVPPAINRAYMQRMGRAIVHSSAIPHKTIGLQSYAKVTSPLRRFSDMIAHWQMEAALRYEARTGQKFDFDRETAFPRPSLPFTAHQMQESIVTLSPREQIIQSLHNLSQHHWAVMAFARAFYYKEGQLPDTFSVGVVNNAGRKNVKKEYARGMLIDYEVKVSIRLSPESDIRTGDEWECKIRHINIFDREIIVEPIRLLNRDLESQALLALFT